jgi:transposase
MVYGAIDLHSRRSEIRVIDEDGRVVRETRVVTERTALAGAFAALGPVRIVVEAGTESTWVAETLEAAGHTVVVVDPNYAPMYGEWHRKVKTDRRDVTALAEANRRGWYRAVHRVSAEQRAMRQVLRSRRQLVQMRTGAISLTRALLRQVGMRVERGTSETLAPVLRVLDTVTEAIATLEAQVRAAVAPDPVVERLVTVPGVGLIVAATFRAVIDDVGRFASAAQVSAALGLVPREDSSAERRHRGHITKAGPRELRSLLVQAAWACWRSGASGTLRVWADRLASRRGRRVAVVGLARRLSRILYAMWRDDRPFDAARLAAA